MYHRIADEVCDPWSLCVSPELFDQQLEVIGRFAQAVTMTKLAGQLKAGRLSRRSIAITLDDGYADNVDVARVLLERRGLPATFYIVSGHVGSEREFWWDELDRLLLQPRPLPDMFELSVNGEVVRADLGNASAYDDDSYRCHRGWRAWEDPPTPRHALYHALWQRMRPMSAANRDHVLDAIRGVAEIDWRGRPARRVLSGAALSALARDPLIEIGSHTITHPMLATLPIAEQSAEIRDCKKSLEETVNRRIESFAYPYGDYSDDTVSLVREIGFTSACSTHKGVVTAASNPMLLPRIFVPNCDGDTFARQLTQWFGDR